MFYTHQSTSQKEDYQSKLKLIGSLSNLFSESITPYLYYRIAEKIFCNSFLAQDLSRGDVAVDAQKHHMGIGLKTFLASNHKSFQKVAEFNSDKDLYKDLSPKALIKKISQLRNARIEFSSNLYSLKDNIYHCVIREEEIFKIYEENMDLININNIKNIKENKGSITFNDGLHDYSFLLSKSTLTKRFETTKIIDSIKVKIIENPMDELLECFNSNFKDNKLKRNIIETIYLPLYGRNQTVYESSGLNQWNAKGRKRDFSEIYIPIPIIIHKNFPNFFPSRDKSFDLILPNNKTMKSKVCQENSKALMSYSNKELGEWLLRDVLKLKEGQLLTYEMLQTIGIDSVRIDKYNEYAFEINFAIQGSYENFKQNLQ